MGLNMAAGGGAFSEELNEGLASAGSIDAERWMHIGLDG